jgi:PAS domain S-box-containing protein
MGEVVRMEQLRERIPHLPTDNLLELPNTAFLLPLRFAPRALPVGCAVLGTNPRYLLDPVYRDFLELVAKQIAQNLQAGQQLDEARQRAEALAELDRVKTEFFSNMSHEFRTPLTLLLSPLEDLLAGIHGDLTEPQHTALVLAHRNSLRLLKQVNALLDFSRIEAGRMRVHIESVDLAALSSELTSGFRPAIERAGLHLIVDCPPLPEPVPVDSEMWEKIVLNLLSNALKFTFGGEIAVRLRTLPNHIELTVRDTGVGIAKEHTPHLFTRFYRVPGSRGRTGEGSGIGLALVHELVRLHYGAVRVQSTPDEGSVFTVWLPRRNWRLQEELVAPAPHSTATGVAPFLEEATQWVEGEMLDQMDVLAGQRLPSIEPLSARSPGARVLVADDNADMRAYLHRLLSQYWVVETVADGKEALTALDRTIPDLLLADVMMPRVDGFALLRAIRERPRIGTLPIILLTARAGEEAAIEGLLAGADDYITKPFSSRELVARVGAQLELARLRRESQAALERSEAFQRASVDASGVGIWELDLRTNHLSLSERAAMLLGTATDGEDAYAEMALRVHLEDRARLVQAQSRAVDPQGDGYYQVEYRVRHPDGRLLWLDSRGRTTFEEDAEGARRPVVLRGALLDVSEQKRFLEVVRQAPNFVAVCGPDLTLDFVNEAGRHLIGQEGVDISQVNLVACFQPDEQQYLHETVLPTVLREGQWTGELNLRHGGNGALLPVECRLYANYADDGSLVGVAVVASDISERKRAEAVQIHFRALFESAPGLYLVIEPLDFRIVAVSDAYLQATMTERAVIMGQPIFEIFPDDPTEPEADGVRNLQASLERVRAEARADVMAVQRYPVRRPASSGGGFEERWWSPVNSPVLGLGGKIAYIIHRVEDVTPFIRQMQQQGQEADGLYQLETRAQHMEAEIVLRAQELQRVNEELRASEERYRALLQSIPRTKRERAARLPRSRQPNTSDT